MTSVSPSKYDLRQQLTDYTSLSVDTVTLHVPEAATLDLAERLEASRAAQNLGTRRGKAGQLLGLQCRLTGHDVFLTGSLSRLVHGSNARAASPDDIARVLGLIADELGVALSTVLDARVYRLDVAANLVVSRAPADYLPALVHVPRAARNQWTPTSLAFVNKTRQLSFYDKLAEITAKGGEVPEALQGLNVLRYELKLMRQLTKVFDGPVTAVDLTTPDFQARLSQVWFARYQTVRTEPVVELGEPKTIPALTSSLARLGIASVGQPRVIAALDGLRAAGAVSADMRGKMRRRVGELMTNPAYVTESDVAVELAAAVLAAASTSL